MHKKTVIETALPSTESALSALGLSNFGVFVGKEENVESP